MANAAASRTAGRSKVIGVFGTVSQFLRESYLEVVKKASWPTWSELKKSTIVVVVAVLIVAVWIAGWDFVFSRITEKIGLFKAASPR